MKLVEERRGEGLLSARGQPLGSVSYSIQRYQAMTTGGLPVPGLHRIEGRLALESLPTSVRLEPDMHLSLDIEDGRRFALTLVDSDGGVLAEGHGPGRCGCC